jgi:hypothetical protein
MLKYTDITQKFNGYGDNGQRKVWTSVGSTHCTCMSQLTPLRNQKALYVFAYITIEYIKVLAQGQTVVFT